MTTLTCGAATDTGRKRSENQDRYSCDVAGGLFIVADGMGGAAAGDVAADAVVTMLPRYLYSYITPSAEQWFGERVAGEVKNALSDLSRHLHDKSARSLRQAGMGSTVVVAIVREGEALIAHLGDSRVYLMRNGSLNRLTNDHSLAQALVASGDMTEAEASARSGLRKLTMHMGMSDRAEPDASAIRIDDGDRLVLCTDGLTTMISEDAIARLLMEYPEPSAAAQALVDAANDAGGKDNTTVVVVQAGKATAATHAQISTNGLDGLGGDGSTVRLDSDIPEHDIDSCGPFRA